MEFGGRFGFSWCFDCKPLSERLSLDCGFLPCSARVPTRSSDFTGNERREGSHSLDALLDGFDAPLSDREPELRE